MTHKLYLEDPYLREAEAQVVGHTGEGAVILDRSVFYPSGGGQPGDSGWLRWRGNALPIATSVKADAGAIALVPAEPMALPPVGTKLVQKLDWDRRHRHMRVHSALHLLSVVMPFGVTGGAISAGYGRIDFNMPDAPEDRGEIEQTLNHFVEMDARVSDGWITEAELEKAPHLVKTMAVKPPRGAGDIRLVRIGEEGALIDLQPCGGTHVARTGEIGALRLGKIEKKGRMNRRVYIHLES
ncbi:MAG: alanyl-tRNA editing protein [Sulfitobacter sp.]